MKTYEYGDVHVVLQKLKKEHTDVHFVIFKAVAQACHNFFVKKPKIFENVKSERAVPDFQKSRTTWRQP